MGDENKIDIIVHTEAQLEGLKKTVEALRQVREEAAAAGQDTKKFDTAIDSLDKVIKNGIGKSVPEAHHELELFGLKGHEATLAMRLLTHSLGEVGHALHYLETGSGVLIGLFAITEAVKLATEKWHEYNEELDAIAEEASKRHTAIPDAIKKAWDEAAKAQGEYKAQLAAAGIDADPTTTEINNQKKLDTIREENWKKQVQRNEKLLEQEIQLYASSHGEVESITHGKIEAAQAAAQKQIDAKDATKDVAAIEKERDTRIKAAAELAKKRQEAVDKADKIGAIPTEEKFKEAHEIVFGDEAKAKRAAAQANFDRLNSPTHGKHAFPLEGLISVGGFLNDNIPGLSYLSGGTRIEKATKARDALNEQTKIQQDALHTLGKLDSEPARVKAAADKAAADKAAADAKAAETANAKGIGTISVDDVIKLYQEATSKADILGAINAGQVKGLSTDQILYNQNIGLPQDITKALIEKSGAFRNISVEEVNKLYGGGISEDVITSFIGSAGGVKAGEVTPYWPLEIKDAYTKSRGYGKSATETPSTMEEDERRAQAKKESDEAKKAAAAKESDDKLAADAKKNSDDLAVQQLVARGGGTPEQKRYAASLTTIANAKNEPGIVDGGYNTELLPHIQAAEDTARGLVASPYIGGIDLKEIKKATDNAKTVQQKQDEDKIVTQHIIELMQALDPLTGYALNNSRAAVSQQRQIHELKGKLEAALAQLNKFDGQLRNLQSNNQRH